MQIRSHPQFLGGSEWGWQGHDSAQDHGAAAYCSWLGEAVQGRSGNVPHCSSEAEEKKGKERRFFLIPFALHLPSFLVTQRASIEPWPFEEGNPS